MSTLPLAARKLRASVARNPLPVDVVSGEGDGDMVAEERSATRGLVAEDEPQEMSRIGDLTPKELGSIGERVATGYLESRGLQILDANWRCKLGEVDIVALDGDVTVLVEVKTRRSLEGLGSSFPELAVNDRKRERYRRLALMYLSKHPEVSSIRFDVIAIDVYGERRAHLRHLVSAFGWDD